MRPIRIVIAASVAALAGAAPAAQIAPSKPYLMAFHGCDGSACSSPTNHRVYLAESNDGSSWTMVPGWTTFAGSVPDVVQRGRMLFVYTASPQVSRFNLDTGTSDRVTLRVNGLPSGSTSDWVDPSMFIDEQGRLVMFLLHAPFVPGGSDPARCPSGVTTCTKQFLSATEVSGSNGTQFTVDPGDRASMTVTTSGAPSSASDPDIFFDGTQYVLYVSHGSSTSVWTSSTLKGTYTKSTALGSGLLSNNTGGVPSGHYDSATSRYWTFTHAGQGGRSVIRRAVHPNLTQPLTESSWTTVMTGSTMGLGSAVSVESPGFATLASGAPTAPAGLVYTQAGSTVVLAWNASVNAASYDVEVGSQAGSTNLVTLSTTEPTLTGVAPNGTYYVRVRGRNGSGTSGVSNEVVISVPACASLAAPASLASTRAGRVVTLTWGVVSGATSYVLEAGSAPGATNILIFDTGSTAAGLTATAPPGTYYVRMRANNACSTGAVSNEITVVVP